MQAVASRAMSIRRVSWLSMLLWLVACAGGPETAPVAPRGTIPVPPVPPEVAEDLTTRYPSDRYVLGIGQADSQQAAVDLARADLAEKIRVRVSTLASDVVRERQGRTEREFSSLVITRANELMEGVELVAQGRDPESGTAYAVVLLSKAEIENGFASPRHDRPSRPPMPAAEPMWVISEGVVPFGSDTTLAEAAARSREEARRRAIEEATGAFVSAQRLVYNAEIAEDVVRSSVRGIVIEEEILEEGVRELGRAQGAAALFYATTLRAKVKPIPFDHRDDFTVEVALNRTVFQKGEEVRVTVVPSHDAYVYVFNVGQDDRVTLLFPNKYAQDNFVAARREIIFPTDVQRDLGIRLRAALPHGEPKAIEKVKVVAAAKQLPMSGNESGEGLDALHDGAERLLVTDLMRQMTSLEGTTWTETTISYEIRQ